MFQPTLLCWLDDILAIAMTPTTTVNFCHHYNFLETNNHLSHCPQNYRCPQFPDASLTLHCRQHRRWLSCPSIHLYMSVSLHLTQYHFWTIKSERKTEAQYKKQGTHLLVFLAFILFLFFSLFFSFFLPCWLFFSLVVDALVFLLLPQFRPHWTLQATNSVIMLSSSVLFLSLWPFFSLLWC